MRGVAFAGEKERGLSVGWGGGWVYWGVGLETKAKLGVYWGVCWFGSGRGRLLVMEVESGGGCHACHCSVAAGGVTVLRGAGGGC